MSRIAMCGSLSEDALAADADACEQSSGADETAVSVCAASSGTAGEAPPKSETATIPAGCLQMPLSTTALRSFSSLISGRPLDVVVAKLANVRYVSSDAVLRRWCTTSLQDLRVTKHDVPRYLSSAPRST